MIPVPCIDFVILELELSGFFDVFRVLELDDLWELVLGSLGVEFGVQIEVFFHLFVLVHFSLDFVDFFINVFAFYDGI